MFEFFEIFRWAYFQVGLLSGFYGIQILCVPWDGQKLENHSQVGFCIFTLNLCNFAFLHIFEYAQLLDYASYEHVWPLILKLQLSNYIQKWSQSGILSTFYENKVKCQYETGVKNPTHKFHPFLNQMPKNREILYIFT